jgi:hypothetical protein
MIVSELIEHLKTFPQDALVIATMFSDYEQLEVEDITLIRAEDSKSAGKGLIRHNGHLMDLQEGWWPKSEGPKPTEPEYITAVHFPGN